jgi:septation ring formation regulator EzrA
LVKQGSIVSPTQPAIKPLTPLQEQKLKEELLSFKQESMALANILSLFHYFYSNIQKERDSLSKKLTAANQKVEDTQKEIADLKKSEEANKDKVENPKETDNEALLEKLTKKLETL